MRHNDDLSIDMLWGAKAIARYMGCTEKTVWNMHHRGQLPTFNQGRRVCARRSSLRAHVEAREKLSSPEQNGAERGRD